MKTTCFIRTSRLLLGLICTITFCTCFCQETKNPQIQKGSKEQEILDLEIRRLNAFATADTNAFKNMVTEDLIIVHGRNYFVRPPTILSYSIPFGFHCSTLFPSTSMMCIHFPYSEASILSTTSSLYYFTLLISIISPLG